MTYLRDSTGTIHGRHTFPSCSGGEAQSLIPNKLTMKLNHRSRINSRFHDANNTKHACGCGWAIGMTCAITSYIFQILPNTSKHKSFGNKVDLLSYNVHAPSWSCRPVLQQKTQLHIYECVVWCCAA